MRAAGHDIRAAIASRTDEPNWARICLEHLVIEDGTVLKDCFEEPLIEISGGSKTGHLRRLQRRTGVNFEEIAFFDNENWNVKDVSRGLPGVECFHTPNGMTREAWDKAKNKFGL
jgi:magnesium-dependent phosphatase 1